MSKKNGKEISETKTRRMDPYQCLREINAISTGGVNSLIPTVTETVCLLYHE